MQIADRLHIEIDQRMARNLLEHMIEEADSGVDRINAGPVQIDPNVDGRLGRFPADFTDAHGSAL
jgi:hypothetical protein